jgi:hypothetical protein
MKTVFSIVAIAMAVLLTGCPSKKAEWKSTAPAAQFNELISKTGKYSFQDGRFELEIFKDTNGLVNYRITRAHLLKVILNDQASTPALKKALEKELSGGLTSTALSAGIADPNSKWFFTMSETPFCLWFFSGKEEISLWYFRDDGTEIIYDFETAPAEIKQKIPTDFLKALPQSVREKIRSDSPTAAPQN